MSAPQARRPPGTPSGGQFATQSHAEAGVKLADAAGHQVGDMYDQADKSSGHWSRTYNVERDELFTKTIESLADTSRDKWTPAYIHAVTRRTAAKMLTGNENGADFEADRQFRDQRADYEQANGRSMTAAEQDQLAERIRMMQAPSRRAKNGFHRLGAVTTVSIYDEHGDGLTVESSLTDTADVEQADTGFQDDLYAAAQAERQSNGVWSAVATHMGAPGVQPKSVRWQQAATIRKQVKALGGAHYVASAYLNGDIAEEAAEPLFVPFGGLDNKGRDKVAETLVATAAGTGDTSRAETAWQDAVRVSSIVAEGRKPRVWKGKNRGKKIEDAE